jgi:hypothetical protein
MSGVGAADEEAETRSQSTWCRRRSFVVRAMHTTRVDLGDAILLATAALIGWYSWGGRHHNGPPDRRNNCKRTGPSAGG